MDKLVQYALKMSGSPVHNIETDTELDKLLKETDVNLVYVTNEKEKGNLHILERAAPQFMETIPFYTTSDPKTASRFGLKTSSLPATVIVKDNGHLVYEGDL